MQFSAMALKAQAIEQRWPSRKALVPRSPRKHRSSSRAVEPRKAAQMKTDLQQLTYRSPQELSFEQLEQAKRLANIVPGRQRPSTELLEKMKKKHAGLADEPIMPPSTPHPLTSLADQFAISSTFTLRSEHSELPNWEVKALEFIRKKRLSMEKDLDHNTWKNKTSMHVRLKLLKDDGYDITALQAKGVSSDQVTAALIDRIAARKKRLAAVVTQATRQQNGSPSVDDGEYLESMEVNDPETTSNVNPAEEPTQLLSESVGIVTPERQVCRPFSPPPMAPQKRKHDHEDEAEDHREPQHCHHDRSPPPSCSCGPESKKIRISTPEELRREVETKAFAQFRKSISRDIFRLSKAHNIPSRIIFKPADPSLKPRAVADAHIGSRGLDRIVEELMWLGTLQEDGTLYIHNGNVPEENPENFICVSKDSQHQVVIEGDSQALVGLMERLRKHDLMHTSTWIFDGMQVVPQDNMTWSLSQDTMDTLAKAEKLLGDGRVEMVIEEVYNSRSLYFE